MMNHSLSGTIASGDTRNALVGSPTCPLCHTLDHTLTAEALRDGGEWTCGRCGQRWDAAQLATAAAYAQYEATH